MLLTAGASALAPGTDGFGATTSFRTNLDGIAAAGAAVDLRAERGAAAMSTSGAAVAPAAFNLDST